MRRRTPVLLLAGSAVLLMAASGGDQVRRPQIVVPQSQPAPPGLRGAQGMAASPAKASTAVRVASAPAAPRLAVASVTAVDPLQCRIACARPYYFCLAGAQPEACPDEWRRCVVGCDWPSTAAGSIEPAAGAPSAR